MIKNPHFDLPFRFTRTQAAVVEQDSIDDVANCIEAILLTHVGWRDEVPSFGVPELAFRIPSSKSGRIETINSIVSEQEPRSDLLMSERPDTYDELISRVVANVGTRGRTP